jgi:RimJ/RimL family protein N-acetyltransferase
MTRIETRRTLLRPFVLDDIPAYAAIRAKPEVVRYITGGARAAERAAEVAARVMPDFIRHWQDHGYGPWAMIEQASGQLMGHMGLRYVPEMAATEILYMLDTPFWGQGYATEGAMASRDHAFGVLQLQTVVAIAAIENKASQRVMRKIGLTLQTYRPYKNVTVALYTLDNSLPRRRQSFTLSR